jgi:hypothetical protein
VCRILVPEVLINKQLQSPDAAGENGCAGSWCWQVLIEKIISIPRRGRKERVWRILVQAGVNKIKIAIPRRGRRERVCQILVPAGINLKNHNHQTLQKNSQNAQIRQEETGVPGTAYIKSLDRYSAGGNMVQGCVA